MARPKKEPVEEVLEKPKRDTKKAYVLTAGRRKAAVARVRLYDSPKEVVWGEHTLVKGMILVNRRPIEKYFSGSVAKAMYESPFKTTNTLGKFSATISVSGGGPKSQLEAVMHGISRALSDFDREKHRTPLKKAGFLTRDSRVRERRKAGMGGKARRKRQSPKR